jgi:hypothetical protein
MVSIPALYRHVSRLLAGTIPFTEIPVSSKIYQHMESVRRRMPTAAVQPGRERALGRCPVTKTIVMTVILAAVLGHAPALHAETAYYVQSAKAPVMSGPTFKSAVLGEVGRGYEFLSLGQEGRWVKVRYNKGEGYVHSIVLLTHPPLENVSAITADEQEMRKGFRRRASSYISSEAEHGLYRDDRKGPGHDEQADYASLEKIELFTMSSREVRRFMEGKQ